MKVVVQRSNNSSVSVNNEIVNKIDSHEFVLPRFQRELDWKTDRIAKLFDSI